jgi:hypothetical protein
MNHEMLAQELIPYADGLGAALAQDAGELLAKKVIETARYVTGVYGNEQAVTAVKTDPAAQERFRKAVAFMLAIEQRARAPEAPVPASVGEKDLLQSKTTWGVLVPIITMLVTHYGFDLGDQQGWVDAISGLIGALLVFWGRVKAIKRVTSIAGVKVT